MFYEIPCMMGYKEVVSIMRLDLLVPLAEHVEAKSRAYEEIEFYCDDYLACHEGYGCWENCGGIA